MKQARIVGLGCFGRPQTFSRILDKILENYSLGPNEANGMVKQGNQGVDGLPVSLVADGYESFDEKMTEQGTKTDRITGFYVSFSDDGPRLSVFACRSGKKPGRYSFLYHGIL